MDKLTKSIEIAPCVAGDEGHSAPPTAKLFFDCIICNYGVPWVVHHDREPRFTSNFWTALFELLGSHVVFSSTFYPQKMVK